MREDFSFAYCPVIQDIDYFHFLTVQERALLSSKATPKRIADFIAGRVAAKKAVRSYLSLSKTSALSILRVENGEEMGKPYAVIDNSGPPLPVSMSITHADQKAYAVASRCPVGIDNVTIEEYSPAFVEEVFQKGELRAWAKWLAVDPFHPLAFCTGFAAKEAFLKWLGVGLRYSLSLLEITPIEHEQPIEEHCVFQKRFRAACCWQINMKNEYMSVILEGYFSVRDNQVVVLMIG